MSQETPEQNIKRLESELKDKEDHIYLLDETIKYIDRITRTKFRKKLLASLPENLWPKDESA